MMGLYIVHPVGNKERGLQVWFRSNLHAFGSRGDVAQALSSSSRDMVLKFLVVAATLSFRSK